jgi:hypothetical protein
VSANLAKMRRNHRFRIGKSPNLVETRPLRLHQVPSFLPQPGKVCRCVWSNRPVDKSVAHQVRAFVAYPILIADQSEVTATFPGWVFDQTRKQYYYYSAEEGAYIYQSGEKINGHSYVRLLHCEALGSHDTDGALFAAMRIMVSHELCLLITLDKLATLVETINQLQIEERTQHKA